MESFNSTRNIGYKFTLENFKNGKLASKLKSDYIQYDTLSHKWTINKYEVREFSDNGEVISNGTSIDTSLNLSPQDFTKRKSLVETMNMFELNDYIANEELKGSEAKMHLHNFAQNVKNIISKKEAINPESINSFTSKLESDSIPIIYRINIQEIIGRKKLP